VSRAHGAALRRRWSDPAYRERQIAVLRANHAARRRRKVSIVTENETPIVHGGSEEVAAADATLREIVVLHAKWRDACAEAQTERDARIAVESDAAALREARDQAVQRERAAGADMVALVAAAAAYYAAMTWSPSQDPKWTPGDGIIDYKTPENRLKALLKGPGRPGVALLAELDAARALAKRLNDRSYWTCGICPCCGFGTKPNGDEYHGKGCVLAAYNAAIAIES